MEKKRRLVDSNQGRPNSKRRRTNGPDSSPHPNPIDHIVLGTQSLFVNTMTFIPFTTLARWMVVSKAWHEYSKSKVLCESIAATHFFSFGAQSQPFVFPSNGQSMALEKMIDYSCSIVKEVQKYAACGVSIEESILLCAHGFDNMREMAKKAHQLLFGQGFMSSMCAVPPFQERFDAKVLGFSTVRTPPFAWSKSQFPNLEQIKLSGGAGNPIPDYWQWVLEKPIYAELSVHAWLPEPLKFVQQLMGRNVDYLGLNGDPGLIAWNWITQMDLPIVRDLKLSYIFPRNIFVGKHVNSLHELSVVLPLLGRYRKLEEIAAYWVNLLENVSVFSNLQSFQVVLPVRFAYRRRCVRDFFTAMPPNTSPSNAVMCLKLWWHYSGPSTYVLKKRLRNRIESEAKKFLSPLFRSVSVSHGGVV